MNEKQSIGRLVSIINRMFSVYMNAQIKNPSVGIGQIRLIKYINQNDGCYQREISNHFMMDKGTTTSLLSNLEKNGFISRKKNPKDSRLKNIYLTQQGIDFEVLISESLKNWTELLLHDFTTEEKETSYQLLNKMVGNIAQLKDEKTEVKE